MLGLPGIPWKSVGRFGKLRAGVLGNLGKGGKLEPADGRPVPPEKYVGRPGVPGTPEGGFGNPGKNGKPGIPGEPEGKPAEGCGRPENP